MGRAQVLRVQRTADLAQGVPQRAVLEEVGPSTSLPISDLDAGFSSAL